MILKKYINERTVHQSALIAWYICATLAVATLLPAVARDQSELKDIVQYYAVAGFVVASAILSLHRAYREVRGYLRHRRALIMDKVNVQGRQLDSLYSTINNWQNDKKAVQTAVSKHARDLEAAGRTLGRLDIQMKSVIDIQNTAIRLLARECLVKPDAANYCIATDKGIPETLQQSRDLLNEIAELMQKDDKEVLKYELAQKGKDAAARKETTDDTA